MNTNLTVSIDWLEFTVLNTQLKAVMDLIQLDIADFTELSTGRFGYQTQLKWQGGHVYVLFTSTNNKTNHEAIVDIKKGVHIMITGQGCRQYSASNNLLNLVELLSARDKVNFSRIDLAIDDLTSDVINFSKIHRAAIKGHFTSRWSKWDEVNSRQTSTNEFLGRTMYFGSQASDLFCRIYDKKLERKANADEEIESDWTRLELVYRKDRARKLVEYLINDELPLGTVLRGTLKQYLRFLKPSNDKNKARWPSIKWWEILLEDVSKLSLTIEKDTKTIEDMTEWVDRQIAPTMAAILKAQEGDLAWLRSILASGSKRLSQRHKDAIKQYFLKEEEE